MAKTADIVIIGAGTTGTSVAYHLAKKGAGKIVLIEKNSIGLAASGLCEALIRHHYLDRPLIEMAKYSSQILSHFEELYGISISFRNNQFAYLDAGGPEATMPLVKMAQECGVNMELMPLDVVKDIHPRGEINLEGIGSCMFDHDAGYCDAYKLPYAYAMLAKQEGVEIMTATEVQEIMTENGKVVGVKTNRGDIACAQVVNAAGCFAMKFVEKADQIFTKLFPLGRLTLNPDVPYEDNIVTLCDTTTPAGMFFMRPDLNGTVICGGEIEERNGGFDPANYQQVCGPAAQAEFLKWMTYRFPFMSAYTVQSDRGALDLRTADWNPGFGYLDGGTEGLYHAIGGSGHCFKFAPAFGEMISADLLGEEHQFDKKVFDINRLVGMKDAGDGFVLLEGDGEA